MDVVEKFNTTVTCEGVSVVVLSLSLKTKGGSVFGDCGQRLTPYRYNIGTLLLLNCACVINTNAPHGHA